MAGITPLRRNALQYSVNFAVSPSAEASREFVNIALGISKAEYAMLASYAFILLYTLFSLVSGRVSDTCSRPATLSWATAVWSLAIVAQATVCTDFAGLFACRLVQGLSMAFTGPQCLSLLAQRFPKDAVSTATSVYTSGVYIGSALASLSMLQNKAFGWRATYVLRGVIGLMLAGAVALLVPEPRDSGPATSSTTSSTTSSKTSSKLAGTGTMEETGGSKVPNLPASEERAAPRRMWDEVRFSLQECGKVLTSKAVRLLLAATALRFCAGFGIGAWAAPLFRANFLELQENFALINALIILGGGCTSSVLGGIIADRAGKKDPHRRLWVPGVACFAAIPLISGACFASSFQTAMALYLLHFLVAECWLGPTLSSLALLLPPSVQGVSQGLFAAMTIFGNITPLLIRYFSETQPLGVALAGCVSLAYASAGFMFFAAAQAAQAQLQESAAGGRLN